MIVMPRHVARFCRAVCKRLLPRGSPRNRPVPIGLLAGPDGLRVRFAHGEAVLEYLHPVPSETARFILPLEALADCEGSSGDATIRALDANRVEITCTGAKALPPHSYSCAGLSMSDVPAWSGAEISNSVELLAALDRAMQTTARESVRFALQRILLRGRQGEVVATDGKQLLIEGGFRFPWPHDLLLPRVNVFAAPELAGGQSVRVALSAGHALFGTGGWTVALKVIEGERFPPVDTVIPSTRAAATIWRLGAGDSEALVRVLANLPAAAEALAPLTVDLGRTATLRARAEGESRPTEVVLAGSTVTGKAVRLATDRRLLARACALGFTEFRVNNASSPVICRDGSRLFLWMTLDAKGALPPHPFPLRLSLTGDRLPASPSHSAPRCHQSRQAVPVPKETVSRKSGERRPGLLS
ncbi:MAG: hypothetical protein ACYC6M_14260, partial [Terriglobales bacterium]